MLLALPFPLAGGAPRFSSSASAAAAATAAATKSPPVMCPPAGVCPSLPDVPPEEADVEADEEEKEEAFAATLEEEDDDILELNELFRNGVRVPCVIRIVHSGRDGVEDDTLELNRLYRYTRVQVRVRYVVRPLFLTSAPC